MISNRVAAIRNHLLPIIISLVLLLIISSEAADTSRRCASDTDCLQYDSSGDLKCKQVYWRWVPGELNVENNSVKLCVQECSETSCNLGCKPSSVPITYHVDADKKCTFQLTASNSKEVWYDPDYLTITSSANCDASSIPITGCDQVQQTVVCEATSPDGDDVSFDSKDSINLQYTVDCEDTFPSCGNGVLDPGEECEFTGIYAGWGLMEDHKEKYCKADDTYYVCNRDTCKYEHVNICTYNCSADIECDGYAPETHGCTFQCDYKPLLWCGDDIVQIFLGEQCDPKNTVNTEQCPQTKTKCVGNKISSRPDSVGNCNSECRCKLDSFSTPVCKKDSCNAECDSTHGCAPTECPDDGCDGNDYYDYPDDVENTCLGNCSCTHNQCGEPIISYNDTSCYQGCQDDNDCDDGFFCNGMETCNTTTYLCQGGTAINCSSHDIPGIETCSYNPDAIPYTWDFRNLFKSTCDEETDSCTEGNDTITHICDVQECDAECDETHSCPLTQCPDDGCDGNDYYDYPDDVENTCLGNCSCTHNQCGEPIISYNDTSCYQGCQDDDDCDYLDEDYCDNQTVMHKVGVCENHVCVSNITTVEDCSTKNGYQNQCGIEQWSCSEELNAVHCVKTGAVAKDELCPDYCDIDIAKEGFCNSTTFNCQYTSEDCNQYDNDYCNGTKIYRDDYWCQSAECSLKEKIQIYECNDGLYCNGQETCTNANCVGGAAINCSSHDIPGIETCSYNPDAIPYTLDYRPSFTSQCVEPGTCTNGSTTITHYCDTTNCSAECDSDDDCNDQDVHTDDYCLANCSCRNDYIPYCGDEIVNQPSEQCDDGNSIRGDGCYDCLITYQCSDLVDNDLDFFVDYPSDDCCDNATDDDEYCEHDCHYPWSVCDWDYCSEDCPCNEFEGDCDYDEECVPGLRCVRDVGLQYGCGNELIDICLNVTECGNGIKEGTEECDDGNIISGDGCSAKCVVEYCGDNVIQSAMQEQCELPDTFNNTYCLQQQETCNGHQLGTRDAYGNCDSICGCIDDTYVYKCVYEECGAECDSVHGCEPTDCDYLDGCHGDDYWNYTDSPNTCTGGCECTDNQCTEPVIIYDYSECVKECDEDADCNDGSYCNGAETCNLTTYTCAAGTAIDCSANNILGIETCTNNPDGKSYTWDYRLPFESTCNEETDSCTTGDSTITHSCELNCGAECEIDADCTVGLEGVCDLTTCSCEYQDAHDLALVDYDFPTTTTDGEVVTFKSKVTNEGTVTESSYLRFYVDDVETPSCRITVTNLASGATTLLYQCDWTAIPGTHMLKIFVDNVTGETDLADNIAEGEIVVEQLYECNDGIDNDGDGDIDYPADIGCDNETDDNESKTRNILLTDYDIPNTGTPGATLTFKTKVRNEGTVTESSFLRFYVDDVEQPCTESIVGLHSSETTPLYECDWTALLGTHTVRLFVDYVDNETSYSDNEHVEQVVVGELTPPIIEDITAEPRPNDTISYTTLLKYGWNFISCPLILSNTNIQTVLSSLNGYYTQVERWNPVLQKFEYYYPSPILKDDYATIETDRGYSVFMIQNNTEFTCTGKKPGGVTAELEFVNVTVLEQHRWDGLTGTARITGNDDSVVYVNNSALTDIGGGYYYYRWNVTGIPDQDYTITAVLTDTGTGLSDNDGLPYEIYAVDNIGTPRNVLLYDGWNFIGWTSLDTRNIDEAIVSQLPYYVGLQSESWNRSTQVFNYYYKGPAPDDFDVFKPGEGYFVSVDSFGAPTIVWTYIPE